MKLTTAPNNNYLIDTRPTKDRFLSDMKNKVDRLTRVPRNTPSSASQQFSIVYNGGTGNAPTPSKVEEPGGVFVFPVSPPLSPWYKFINDPAFYGLTNVNNVQLNVSLFNVLEGNLVVADSLYTVDFYLTIFMSENINGQFVFGSDFNTSSYNTTLLQLKQTYTHDPAISTLHYEFSNANTTLNLSDYILSRNIIQQFGFPDFTTDPTKIMKFQYDKILESPVYFYCDWGYDDVQAKALTGNNLNHFKVMVGDFTGSPPTFGGLLASTINISVNYSGTFADYEPINP